MKATLFVRNSTFLKSELRKTFFPYRPQFLDIYKTTKYDH